MNEYDTIIVGGGPAGLAAGIALAGAGLRALVLERRRYPVEKACGEGLMPVGVAHLQALGAADWLDPGDYAPFAGIRYVAPSGREAVGRFADGPGWGVPRRALSAALRRRAAGLASLEVREGVRAVPIGRDPGGRVRVRMAGAEVCAPLLIAADGLGSPVRRWAGLEGPPARLRRWGIRRHFARPPRGEPLTEFVEVHWRGGLEAYLTPCGPGLVGLAFLWDRDRRPGLPGGAGLFPALLREFPEIERRLAGAKPCDPPQAAGPLLRRALRPVAPGLLLLGDAAGYIDAVTGEGLSLALAAAAGLPALLGPRLAAARSGGPGSDRGESQALSTAALAPYARSHAARFRAYAQVAGLALLLSRFPPLAERAIAGLARRPALFTRLLSANAGLASPWLPAARALLWV